MSYVSLGGKYSGVITKKLKNGATSFFIAYRNSESKVIREKVGNSPDMTKAKALEILRDTRKEISAKRDLIKNPNSPIPKILKKNIDKKLYTLNDLSDFYFENNTSKKTNRDQQNKYNYHFREEAFASKNVNLITEDDVNDFIQRKSKQRADNRRSNSTNVTFLNRKESKRKRKSRAKDLRLEEREQEEFDKNNLLMNQLELVIESYKDKAECWREVNKVKYLRERNKVLSYRLFKEKAEILLKDKSLSIDDINALLGILSRKTIKELLLLISTIITFFNDKKKLNIANAFLIRKGNSLYITVDNSKNRYLTKVEIKAYLQEVKKVALREPQHKYIYLISLLALSTGSRRDSILSLKIEGIDLETGNISFRNFKTEKNFTGFISSSEIKNEIVKVIDNRDSSSFLFEGSVPGTKIATFPPKMKEILDYTVNCNRSYLKHLTIKEFRNTVASHLAMGGTPIAYIAKVLDHASIRTTEIYAKLSPSVAKEDLSDFSNDFLTASEEKSD